MNGEAVSSLREIVEEEQFSNELAILKENPRRADEFIDGVKNALSRDPAPIEATCLDEKYPLWFIPCSCEDIVIFYTFNDNKITLLSIIDSRKL